MARSAPKVSGPAVAAPKPQVASPTAESEASQVTRSLGAGTPLPTTTRGRMERAFGQSFGDVRVHTDGAAARATSRHDAAALTVGNSVAFAPGMFSPGTPRGDHLIAHELAHVVQQAGRGSAAQARSLHSVASEGAEQQAESAASRVVSGRSANIARGSFATSTRSRIMRRARSSLTASIAMPAAAPLAGGGLSPTRSAMSPALSTQSSAGGGVAAASSLGPLRPGQLRDTSPRGLRNAIVARATTAADKQKTPDQAQTAIAKEPGSPPTAMVAGASPGATAGDKADGKEQGGGRDQKKRKGRGKDDDDKKKKQGAAGEQRGGGGGGGLGGGGLRRHRTRRFGHIPGDRGEAQAHRALTRLERRTTAQKHHEAPLKRIEDAKAAVEPPPTEQLSRAAGTQVAAVADGEAPRTNAAAANQSVDAEVTRLAPRNMSEMSDYDPASLREHVSSTVGTQVTGIQDNLSQVNAVPTPRATIPAHPQPAAEQPPRTAAPRSATAVPPPVPDTTLDASEYKEDADAAFEENGVSERARQNASEGPLREMRDQEEGIDRASDDASNRVRDQEMAARNEARSELQAADEEAESDMASTRDRAETRVSGEQNTTRTGHQTDRMTVTEQIEGIYNGTATFVNNQLSTLTQTTTQRFDTEQTRYLEEFKSNTRRDIEIFKDDRYSTPFVGWGRWVKDRFVSINELQDVKDIYERNRSAYIGNITRLINGLTAEADALIATCRLLITVARLAIDALVAAQPPRLRAEAEAAQARVNQQFQQLERQIETTSRQVRNALETRRERAIEAVDQALAEIQAENASLVDRLVAFVKAIYNALKQFFQLMVRIEEMGIGTFLSRALDQAKSGVKNHLWNELKNAFQEWLMMKLSFLQPLLLLPSNFLEVLTAAAMNLFNLVLEALPEALPALGVAAMTWLAIQLAAKLIPGVGAIMAIIDAIRAAWSLIQSLIRAASAFFEFLLLVAGGGDGSVQFARALAWGIIAAVDALLTFLGVDSLLRRIARPIGRPMGRILGRLSQRRQRARSTRQQRRRRDRDEDRGGGNRRGEDHHRARSEASRARADRRAEGNRRRTSQERHSRRDRNREANRPRRDSRSDARRRRDQQRRERLERRWRAGIAAVERLASQHQGEDGIALWTFRARLLWLRARYRFSRLALDREGRGYAIDAAMNPRARKPVRAHVTDPALVGFPRGESATTGDKVWDQSRSGNRRLYFERRADRARTHYWRSSGANQGRWQPVPQSRSGGEAERLAREKLARDKDDFVAMVPPDRHPSAPGLDAAGVGRDRTGPHQGEDRVTFGEGKESVANRHFTVRDVTALRGGTFRRNLRDARAQALDQGGQAAVDRVDAALQAGRIDFVIYLRGSAQFSPFQVRRLKLRILATLRAYLRSRQIPQDAINQAVRNVDVRTEHVGD